MSRKARSEETLMRKLTLAAATAIGTVIGAVLFNATPARADLPTIDATVLAAVNAVKGVLSDINGYIQDVKDFLSATGPIASLLGDNTFGTVEQLLQQGFTQTANYQKASVGALEQIFDASNTANARFKRDVRNAQIRDEQTPSPTACTALDGGVSTQAAAVQAFTVAATMAKIHDLRGEAGPNMPSHFGQAQAVASISQQHLNYYCDANDVAAGLCGSASSIPDADQQYSSLFGSGTYADQNAVNTAKDYAINLIQPIAPAALRGDQLNSAAGQDAAVRRHRWRRHSYRRLEVALDRVGELRCAAGCSSFASVLHHDVPLGGGFSAGQALVRVEGLGHADTDHRASRPSDPTPWSSPSRWCRAPSRSCRG
jgi:hypothetical protein